jgi:hypothetical protein
MNYKKSIPTIIALALLAPLLMAFMSTTLYQQKWWQRKKTVAPLEFSTLNQEQGYNLEIVFEKGRRHNHPLMAFWIEDTTGSYVQSLYVAQSIAKGYFQHGDASAGRWEPGPLRRPAALPYWGHKRGIKAADGYFIPTQDDPMPDAVTGATPKADFILSTRTKDPELRKFNLLMEINQSWDWNQYWHNNKYPDDPYYKTSSQPALVYKVTIDLDNPKSEYTLQPIGHSHWSGANGNLYEDLSTITTALDIVKEIKVRLK